MFVLTAIYDSGSNDYRSVHLCGNPKAVAVQIKHLISEYVDEADPDQYDKEDVAELRKAWEFGVVDALIEAWNGMSSGLKFELEEEVCFEGGDSPEFPSVFDEED
jgi:hypothetical protein